MARPFIGFGGTPESMRAGMPGTARTKRPLWLSPNFVIKAAQAFLVSQLARWHFSMETLPSDGALVKQGSFLLLLGLSQNFSDDRQKFGIIHGLLQKGFRSRIEGTFLVSETVTGRNDNDGDHRKKGYLRESFHHNETIPRRQAQVENDYIRPVLPRLNHTGEGIGCKESIVIVCLEAHVHAAAYVRIIIHNENFLVTHFPPSLMRFRFS
jgi:hypothetical protein